MQQSFQTLIAQMSACKICDDLPLGPNPVFQLDARAKILIVGQAPGRAAHIKNRPFDDLSGDRLRSWLALDAQQFYGDPRIGIFPMGLCFPGTGKTGDNPPPKICAKTWRKNILDRLAQVELTLVLGSYAIAWHLPAMKSRSVADAVKTTAHGGTNLFVLPHPSPRNNRWLKQNAWFETDVVPRIQDRVKRALAGPVLDETQSHCSWRSAETP